MKSCPPPPFKPAATPLTIWMTGLSGSGKSTLAECYRCDTLSRHETCFVLDGDVVRTGLCRGLGFSERDRHENIRRVAEVARLMNQAGVSVVCALISPLRCDRAMALEIIGRDRFLEVHIAAPLEVCEQRDTKGLYRRARAGEVLNFTGIDSAYEPPEAPDLKLDSANVDVSTCVDAMVALVAARRHALEQTRPLGN